MTDLPLPPDFENDAYSDDAFEQLFSDRGITSQVSAAGDVAMELEVLRQQVEDLSQELTSTRTALDQQVERREVLVNDIHRLRRQLNESRAVVVENPQVARSDELGAPPLRLPRWLSWANAPTFRNNAEKTRTASVLNLIALLFIPVSIGLMVLRFVLTGFAISDIVATLATGFGGALIGVVLWWMLQRGWVTATAWGLVLALFGLVTVRVYTLGTIQAPIASLFLLVVALATLFLGRRTSLVISGVVVLTLLGLTVLEMQGVIRADLQPANISQWVTYVVAFVLLIYLLQITSQTIRVALAQAQSNATASEQANRQLQNVLSSMEARVAESRRDLQLASDVVRAISTELEAQALMARVVNVLRETFDLYYVGLFLVNAEQNSADLRAGTGEAGYRMLTARHRLPIASTSMIGAAISNREMQVTGDVRKQRVFYANPYLPFTRSELALPLISRGRSIGALTIQSMQPNEFDEDGLRTLSIMGELIAVALDNALIFERSQRLLVDLETTQRQQVAETWTQYLEGSQSIFQSSEDIPGLAQVVSQQTAHLFDADGAQQMTVPLQLRGEVIGALNLEGQSTVWAEDELALVNAIADQAAQALENLRLIDDSRRTALRAQLINNINDKLLRSPDIETIVETTLVELARALDVPQISLQIGTERDLLRASNQNGRVGENGYVDPQGGDR